MHGCTFRVELVDELAAGNQIFFKLAPDHLVGLHRLGLGCEGELLRTQTFQCPIPFVQLYLKRCYSLSYFLFDSCNSYKKGTYMHIFGLLD